MATQPEPLKRPPDADRRARILAAAEAAFVRHGFRAATMHDVAEEAGMSAGNLYRYFASKEALVEDLCRCDRDVRMAEFEQLATGGDFSDAVTTMIGDRLLREPRAKACLAMEIWAEATRNARVGEILRAFDAATLETLRERLDFAKARGEASATIDSGAVARIIFTLVSGLFKRLALEPDFEPRRESAAANAILRALLTGALSTEI